MVTSVSRGLIKRGGAVAGSDGGGEVQNRADRKRLLYSSVQGEVTKVSYKQTVTLVTDFRHETDLRLDLRFSKVCP